MVMKKKREKLLLEQFKALYADFPEGEIKEYEEPDFLVKKDDNNIVGIELVDYVRGQKKVGSIHRRDESLHQRIANKARSQFEESNDTPLMVHFTWNDYHHPSKAEIGLLAESAAKIVIHHIPRRLFDVIRIRVGELPSTPLRKFVHFIDVTRVRDESQILWSSIERGWIGVKEDEVQSIINSKNSKVNVYNQNCNNIWLLIIADGAYVSSTVEIQSQTREYTYQSDFDKIFFWDYQSQEIVRLALEKCG